MKTVMRLRKGVGGRGQLLTRPCSSSPLLVSFKNNNQDIASDESSRGQTLRHATRKEIGWEMKLSVSLSLVCVCVCVLLELLVSSSLREKRLRPLALSFPNCAVLSLLTLPPLPSPPSFT